VPRHTFGAFAPLAPPSLDRSAVLFTPQMYENDTLPDCTAVAYANAARAVAALNHYNLAVDPPTVPAFYGAVLGHPPDLAATDGAAMLDVLDYQDAHGMDIGPQRLSAHFGAVDAKNRHALAASLDRFGPGYWGVVLRERDLDTAGLGQWTISRDDGEIVDRHAVMAWDYTGLGNADTVRLGTWGGWIPASWGWVLLRIEEAYSLFWRQLATASGYYLGRPLAAVAAALPSSMA
jgi:hypothetical protein